jgi:hypothetical protein
MTRENLYDHQETDVAWDALLTLSRDLPEPFVLIGGWAVYLTTNRSYQKEHGVGYLGSRDIDIGFHVDPDCSEEALRNSTFGKALEVLQETGYSPHGSFRYCKIIKRGSGEVLTEQKAASFPMHELFYLYVDMMVDNIHPKHKAVFKFDALDEPIILRVFNQKKFVRIKIGDGEVMIPPPGLLLASKLNSIPNREKNDKQWKDACDIYAIIWHSEQSYKEIISFVQEEYREPCDKAVKILTGDVAERAARHLGIEKERFLQVISLLRI